MGERVDLLVIIPTHNHLDYARRAVISLLKETSGINLRCAVIDDASAEWDHEDWEKWPRYVGYRVRYNHWGGLTRSWNRGLQLARDCGATYTVCANSDILFTPNWYAPLRYALEMGWDLVGPLTNAPGHCPWQDVAAWYSRIRGRDDRAYEPNDSIAALQCVSNLLHVYPQPPFQAWINGFFMMATTATWWKGALESEHVFNPFFPLAGNEDELQNRWVQRHQFRIGVVPTSFIFHYRSVSRPEGLSGRLGKGACRYPLDTK